MEKQNLIAMVNDGKPIFLGSRKSIAFISCMSNILYGIAMVKGAIFSDITAPSTLQSSATGHVMGYVTNTGNEDMVLYADLFDADTSTVIYTQGPMSVPVVSPVRSLNIPFVMPSHDLHWFLVLREDIGQYDRYPAFGYQTITMSGNGGNGGNMIIGIAIGATAVILISLLWKK